MLRLAIVDDHGIVRAGFREMLAEEVEIVIIFEASSGEEALQQLRECGCDILLLDLSLPGQSGVDVLRAVRRQYPETKVLMLSGFPEERYALAMIRHGADGYLSKECERDELIRAIRTVASGRRYVSTRTAELLAGECAGEIVLPTHAQLSDRELEVFLQLARGASVSDIAAALNLSVKTVSTYRSRLLEKLSLSSNAEIAAYAIRHGLILG
ncbi:MAG: transcriptional regulator, LuxR family [Rhodocyclaceae bacterium]|nr:transcriptional regulator, LuxR family [Rhodocyclaceae bacterium]